MIDHSSRSHALLSASSAHRWLNCPSSALTAEIYPGQDTEFTREGTRAHEVAERVAKGIRVVPDADQGVDAAMIEHASAYLDYINEQIRENSAQVLLEQRVDYSPWAPEGFGTCDCIILQGRSMTIIDYKYGQGVSVEAEGNPQMMLYALGAINDFGIAYDIKDVEMHIFQPRIGNISSANILVEDLLEWGEKTVKPLAAMAYKGEGGYKAGAHCKFCPHAGQCPELTHSCINFAETHGVKLEIPTLTAGEIAEVLAMEPIISLWLKRVKDQALTSLLEGKDIPGYKLVEGRSSRSWADEKQVLNLLTALGYGYQDITETKLLSVAQMEKAIGKKKAGELLGELISKKAGAPSVAPDKDRRAAYDRMAAVAGDFADD